MADKLSLQGYEEDLGVMGQMKNSCQLKKLLDLETNLRPHCIFIKSSKYNRFSLSLLTGEAHLAIHDHDAINKHIAKVCAWWSLTIQLPTITRKH